ncbi:MAG: AraC family transcriptional regulator [Pseudacidovorax sp.]|nr:AraC family transcriptional regulator [Pseudacidovorax sp.]
MNPPIPLSSKLAVLAECGFAVMHSRQAKYNFDWHTHDCAMLLWPRLGALDSRWAVEPGAPSAGSRLVRHMALLLPAAAAHTTRARATRQHHGELYLRPELLGHGTSFGALQLDMAASAILEALSSPSLSDKVGAPLVDALVKQLATLRPAPSTSLPADDADRKVPQRMLHCYTEALEAELPMPTVEAVALRLGVSTRQLQRVCAIELGASPVGLRRQLMAAKAREMLARGIPASIVSQQLCLTHSGHLTRLLRDVASS